MLTNLEVYKVLSLSLIFPFQKGYVSSWDFYSEEWYKEDKRHVKYSLLYNRVNGLPGAKVLWIDSPNYSTYLNKTKQIMEKMLAAFLVFLVLIPSLAVAQEKKISFVEESKPAPFTGYLLSPAAFAELKVASSTQEALFTAKLEYELGKQEADYKFQLAQVNADNNFLKKENKLYIQDIEYWQKKSKRSLWENIDGQLGLAIGFSAAYYLFHVVLKTAGDK